MNEPAHLHCIGCGYDLTGATIGGVCPECALPVERSIKQSEGSATRNVNATATLTMGVLSLVLSLPLGLFALYYFFKTRRDYRDGICSRASYRWAVIGLILGIISAIMTVLLVIAIATNRGASTSGFVPVQAPWP